MKKVLLLLCEGVEVLEAAAFYDVLGWSGASGLDPVKVITAGLHTEVNCSFGLKIIADALLQEIDVKQFDALAIPGGFEAFGFYKDAYSEQVTGFIKNFGELKKPIASICVGALPLAKTGLLIGQRGTTYHLMEGKRRQQLAEFGVQVIDEPIVRTNNIRQLFT
jgi:4-methyl-5(b-hydroxyethyl)-thiazole monophosphate biosynthesis